MSEGPSLYVVDVDSVIDGSASRFLRGSKITGRVLLHKSIIEYLYISARKGYSTGLAGLNEAANLLKLSSDDLEIVVVSDDKERIKDLEYDDVKRIVREYAWKVGATLITSDPIQAMAAEALGVDAIVTKQLSSKRLKLEGYFDSKTMSVHLKEGAPPLAKVGRPGHWVFIKLRDEPLTRTELEEMAREIIEAANINGGFVEIDRAGSTIIQLSEYRIVITRPPLSEGWEITAVRPIAKFKLEDYDLPEKLFKRLLEKAEGILIAGAPGMGKTTFAQALAQFYAEQGRIVKTIESPRDMRLPPIVTQYSKNYADLGELHDILLLSRPDYTVFDELRNDEDFKLYVDLRLAGIGMIGVVHATTPIDAIQRFIRRVELGMIPSIIDTVIFINEGRIERVYELSMTVKLPTGLREAELARPVVEVRDFLTGELEYEIYTFGEQTMVIPVKRARGEGLEALEKSLRKLLPDADIEIRGGLAIIKIPRHSTRITARKIKRAKKLVEKHGLEARFMPA